MRFVRLILALIVLALTESAEATPLSDCAAHYFHLSLAIEGSYYKVSDAQRNRLDPLRDSVLSTLRFLASPEGQTGYPTLCTADIFAELSRAESAVKTEAAEAATSLPREEAEAERKALLEALREYRSRPTPDASKRP